MITTTMSQHCYSFQLVRLTMVGQCWHIQDCRQQYVQTSQNILFTLRTTIFMAKHGVEVRLEKIVVKDDPSMFIQITIDRSLTYAIVKG
jgi:hypothetical protein